MIIYQTIRDYLIFKRKGKGDLDPKNLMIQSHLKQCYRQFLNIPVHLPRYFLKEKKCKGVWIAPDPNAGKFVRHYSKVSGLPMAFGYKYRAADSMHEIEELKLLGDISGRDVAIIDDQSATSRTLLRAVNAAKALGAKRVYCAVTHGMFLGDAQKAFRDAVKKGLMEELICTNTLIQPKEFLNKNRYIKVLDGLRLFAEAIFETYTGGSISRLYEAPLRDALFGRT